MKGWSLPTKQYFDELYRVSVEQIIWGANYYSEYIRPHRCFIIWDKICVSETFGMAMCEYASCSISGNAKIKSINAHVKDRFHFCQKPVRLYEWLLKNYAKPGDKILDTHGGSMSIAIACDIMGFDLDLYEIDEDYFKAGKERFERHKQQEVLDL